MDREALAEYSCAEIEWTAKARASAMQTLEDGKLLDIGSFFPSLGKGYANWVKVRPIIDQLPFTPGMYVDIQPFRDEQAFRQEIGLGLDDFLALVRNGRVRPYINSMLSRYEGLDWLDPFFELRPPTFIRYTGFFDAVGGGRYYADFMEGLTRFKGQLGGHQSMGEWGRKFHHAGRYFETKVAFDYARLRALRPDLADRALQQPTRGAQAEDILLADAQVVDPYTNAFGGFYRFDPKYIQGHPHLVRRAGFELGVGKALLQGLSLEFPQDLTIDDLILITKDPVWKKGAEASKRIQRELEQRAEEPDHDPALELPRIWAEIAEALRANAHFADRAATLLARVSLGVVGGAIAVKSGETGAVAGLQSSAPGMADQLRPSLGRIGMLGQSRFIAAAWDYDQAARRATGRTS